MSNRLPGALPSTAPTLRDVLIVAVPIMLSNATAPLVGFVDAVVVGQLGAAHLIGGVAMASAIFNAIYWGFGFLRMGTTGFTAQAHGASDTTEVAATLARALLVALICSAVVVVFQVPVRNGFLWFLGGSPQVQDAARTYYDIRIWATPAGLINFALLGWFIGLGRTMVAFWLQLGLNVVNMALAVVLTLSLGWGVHGVGTAALVAEWFAAAVGLIVAFNVSRRRGASLAMSDVMHVGKLVTMLAANRDILIRTACVLGAMQIFVMQGAQQGDIALAANAVLANVVHITYYLLDGYAHAAETLVGQAVGSRDRPRLDGTVRLTMIASALTGLVVGAILWLAGPAIIAFMTPNPDIRALAQNYLIWAALLPFVAVWCFMYDGIFIGATRTADMRNMMLLSFAGYLGAIAVLVPAFANHGVWAAHAAFFVIRGLTLAWKYPALANSVGPKRPT
jgi:MATE family multidrug resistance protein